jgi:DNA invertase Pin-like site-specific DNA recombinase
MAPLRRSVAAGGRKPKLNERQIRKIKTLLTDPVAQVKDIAERYGVSRTTLYKRVGVVHSQKPG